MVLNNKTFRVFVSSTFADLKEERNALQREVFPKLRELCMKHGCRFQAIDLRWGLSGEAGLDQQTMKICLEEIERSQDVSPRPNFIVLLGERYGWQPVPYQIPEKEYDKIFKHVDDEKDQKLLNKWFQRDDNALRPDKWFRQGEDDLQPVYDLQPRTGKYEDNELWNKVENDLNTILRKAVLKTDLKERYKLKYFASATEQEIWKGLNSKDANEHVFGFFREIENLPSNLKSDYVEQYKSSKKRLCLLKKQLREKIKCTDHKFDWTKEGDKDRYLQELGDEVYKSLSEIILNEINQLSQIDHLDKEIQNHLDFGMERSEHFHGRIEILKEIKNYLKQKQGKPLVINGVSGSGKTALIAETMKKLSPNFYEKEGLYDDGVIIRFIGATPESSDIRSLLDGICRQINRIYGEKDNSEITSNYQEIINKFSAKLRLATIEKPLFIFLDALDQLSDFENAKNLIWLPSDLPEHVHLVVSTLPCECLEVLERRFPDNILKLKHLKKEDGKEILDLWLKDANRTLQEHQYNEIMNKFGQNRLPIYLKLAFEEANKWKSYTDPTNTILGNNVPLIIHDLLNRLSNESNHGEIIVSRSLSYIATSRYGLSEDELIDALSLDRDVFYDFLRRARSEPTEILENIKEVLKNNEKNLKEDALKLFENLQKDRKFCDDIFERLQEKQIMLKLPMILWSRLYFDMVPYFNERNVNNILLLTFYHPQIGEAINKKYLTNDFRRIIHLNLAEYFNYRLINNRKSDDPCNYRLINNRIVDELPWQLSKAQEWERLKTCITYMDVFLKLMEYNKRYELMGYWLALKNQYGIKNTDIVDTYKISIDHCKTKIDEELLAIYYNSIGFFLDMNGLYDDAESFFENALEIRERIFSNRLCTAESLNNLAEVFRIKGDYNDAKPLYFKVLEIHETLCSEDIEIAKALNNLAALFEDIGEYDKAEEHYKRAFKIYEKELGCTDPITAIVLGNLALLLTKKGNYNKISDNEYEIYYNKAEKLHKRVLKIRENILGLEHPETATSLNNLGLLLNKKENYDDAELLHKSALKIRKKVLGSEHPETANSHNNLAEIFREKGEYESAETHYIRALHINKKYFGYDHVETAINLDNLALLYRKKENYLEAESLNLLALAIFMKKLGPNHQDTIQSYNNLLHLLKDSSNYIFLEQSCNLIFGVNNENSYLKYSKNIANRIVLDTIIDFKENLGSEILVPIYPGIANSFNDLAEVFRKNGDYKNAEPLYRLAITISKKLLGHEHSTTAIYLDNLALLFHNNRNYKEAEFFNLLALFIFIKKLGLDHPDTIQSCNNLFSLFEDSKDCNDVEEEYWSIYDINCDIMGLTHPNTFITSFILDYVRSFKKYVNKKNYEDFEDSNTGKKKKWWRLGG